MVLKEEKKENKENITWKMEDITAEDIKDLKK